MWCSAKYCTKRLMCTTGDLALVIGESCVLCFCTAVQNTHGRATRGSRNLSLLPFEDTRNRSYSSLQHSCFKNTYKDGRLTWSCCLTLDPSSVSYPAPPSHVQDLTTSPHSIESEPGEDSSRQRHSVPNPTLRAMRRGTQTHWHPEIRPCI